MTKSCRRVLFPRFRRALPAIRPNWCMERADSMFVRHRKLWSSKGAKYLSLGPIRAANAVLGAKPALTLRREASGTCEGNVRGRMERRHSCHRVPTLRCAPQSSDWQRPQGCDRRRSCPEGCRAVGAPEPSFRTNFPDEPERIVLATAQRVCIKSTTSFGP